MRSDDFARVLAEAGEPDPGPRPDGWDGWDGWEMLARMHEDVATLRARAAARWAVNADQRRAALELYRHTCEAEGADPGRIPPWLGDGPSFDVFGG